MEELKTDQFQESRPERTKLLSILCILTFIGSGMNFFSDIIIALFYDQFIVFAESIGKIFHVPGLEMILDGKSSFFALSALICVISFTGAILMWKSKKAGFHVYTISQILLILLPMYFFNLPMPSFLDIILSGIFVILYSSNLKYMS
jgi:hypothetical protein